jgi:ABC-type Fe3+-hydroxamate transport system substrate-binding protein
MDLSRSMLLAAALCIGSASTSLAEPVEVIDAIGRQVIVNVPAKRAVINFNFEEFTAVAGVDGWARVVGMSRALWGSWRPVIFNRYKAVIPNLATMPDIGNSDDGTFSAEKVIALKPDVFFVAAWMFKALKGADKQIEAAGIPLVVIDYNAQTLESHLASTRLLGTIMGAEARAEELARFYEARFKDVMMRVEKASVTRRPRVYLEIGWNGADVYGNTYDKSFWGLILKLMKADNIAAGKVPGAYGPINAEAVIAANPEAIFITGSSWANRPNAVRTGYDTPPDVTRASLAPYAARPGWADLAAIKSGNISAMEHGLARSLSDFVAMQYIGKRLYPEAFADIDPHAEFKAYHERFLPVSFNGTWVLPLKP